MKRLFYLMLVVLGTAAFVSCSKDDDENNGGNQEPIYHYGEITMVNEAPDNYSDNNIYFTVYTFNVGDTITIDYGDGYVQETVANESYNKYDDEGNIIAKYGMIGLGNTYSDREKHTITIKGNISGLYCCVHELTSLNVSRCTALTDLDCDYNQLTSLDVSKNTALTYLDCNGNDLSSLDISKNTALTYLGCEDNELTTLDVSKNTALTELSCSENQLTSLDVSNNTALTILLCNNNQLPTLDVSNNTALTILGCAGNQFTAAEMNKIYEALPTVENGNLYCDQLGNPSIAEQKGWIVSFPEYY